MTLSFVNILFIFAEEAAKRLEGKKILRFYCLFSLYVI